MAYFVVTGTITKVGIADVSKTSRVKHLITYLHLKTSSGEILKFERKPSIQSDSLLRIGDRISILAKKNDNSDISDIIQIESLQDDAE